MKEFILSNIDELDTFDSYYGTPHIEEDYITIPFINMGLMKEHPLNHSNRLLHIDFCFLQIVEPKYISVYERGIIKNELEENYEFNKSKWYGGSFIGNDSVLDAEMEIQASDVFLFIPKDFKMSSNSWIPDIMEFTGRGNIPGEVVNNFLNSVSGIGKITINFEG